MSEWYEYVHNGLMSGQQVFRRVILENLLEEIDREYSVAAKPAVADSANIDLLKSEIAGLKMDLRHAELELATAKFDFAKEHKRFIDTEMALKRCKAQLPPREKGYD